MLEVVQPDETSYNKLLKNTNVVEGSMQPAMVLSAAFDEASAAGFRRAAEGSAHTWLAVFVEGCILQHDRIQDLVAKHRNS